MRYARPAFVIFVLVNVQTTLLADLEPVGAIEEELARGVVEEFWRLRRVPKIERGILAHGVADADAFEIDNLAAARDERHGPRHALALDLGAQHVGKAREPRAGEADLLRRRGGEGCGHGEPLLA